MSNAIDGFIGILHNKSNKQKYDVAGHDVKVLVVDCDGKRLAIGAGKVGEGFYDIAKVPRSYC